MKRMKKYLALFLSLVMLVLIAAAPVSAASKVDPSEGTAQKMEAIFYMLLDKLVKVVGKILNTFIPGLDWGKTWQNYDDYLSPEGFYEGEESFERNIAADSQWSAGYAYESLLDGLDILNGEYGIAGALQTVKIHEATEILDDQGVNVYALSDGTSGIVVHAVIDGFGIARGDVLVIRDRLASFAKENNIVSINISALHQHSLIDTLGMGVALVPALILNPGMSAVGMDKSNFITGKNENFMENLYSKVSSAIIAAVEDMEEGTLYYGSADASDLMHDKRKPEVFDGEIHRFRFDPVNEESDEIWICEAGIHCTGFSSDDSFVSSDFPYYFKEYVKETTGADVVYVQGAETAITTDRTNVKYTVTDAASKVRAYGVALADRVKTIDNETELSPVLNIALCEVSIKADNPVHILAVREGIVDSVAVKDGSDFSVVTELGYMELGNKVGVILAPGEMAPEIIWGGAVTSTESWTKESWNYAPLKDTAGAEKVICFGLNNDQIGYILPDNDIRSMFTENEEINVVSKNAGSTVAEAFEKLIADVK